MTDRYIELHARTAFSFLQGASSPEDIADRCAELPALVAVLGQPARVAERAGGGVDVALHQRRRSHSQRGAERRWVALARAAEERPRRGRMMASMRAFVRIGDAAPVAVMTTSLAPSAPSRSFHGAALAPPMASAVRAA